MALNHKIRCCKRCGHIEMWQKELIPVCEYCNSELVDTEYILQDVLEHGEIKPEIRKTIFEKYIKNSPLYSEEAVKNREEKESWQMISLPSSYKSKNIPKCPTCGSTNICKITNTHKAGKIALFGIFGAGDLGKTWKCNNCGSKF